jgi:hypothetical protein
VNAVLFAFVYNGVFAIGVVLFILWLRRRRMPSWLLCATTLVGALFLWLLMYAFLYFAIEPNLDLQDAGHAGGNFLAPYLLFGAAIILISPVVAYGLRTSNS